MILVIDNYDSFVHNLARYFQLAGHETNVVRNDAVTITDIKKMKPKAIVLSPGPCAPKQAGICVELIKALGSEIPLLGVCLGHQCIGEAYGGMTIRGPEPVHGKASEILHDGSPLFSGLPNPLRAGRYHSLIVELASASPLMVTARTVNGRIMAMQHRHHPVYGVQFHPESALTEQGLDLVRNFCDIARMWHAQRQAA